MSTVRWSIVMKGVQRALWSVLSSRRLPLITATILGAAVVAAGADSTIIDFAAQDPDLLISGVAANASLGADIAVGDLDGDGAEDLVIGAPWAHRNGAEQFAGRVYIFFGGQERPASLSVSSADVTIIGAAANDGIGGGLFERQPGTIAIGDLNDDGLDDLILGAADAQGRSGEVRVIFGRSRGEWEAAATFDLAQTPGDILISAGSTRSWLGTTVAAGDVNGDGIADLVAGAPGADGPQGDRRDAGEAYVFFGRQSWQPNTLVAEDDADVRIVGVERDDLLGSGLAVGQLGGSEVADLAIGVRGGDGPANDRGTAGEVYVLFGAASLGGTYDMAAVTADWMIYGADNLDEVSRYIAVGDVSGDGQPDLVIGVVGGDGPDSGRMDAGEVAVLLGPRTTGTVSDLANGADFTLYGRQGSTSQQPGGRLGDSVALGDFSGDGVLDVVAGSRMGNGFNGAHPDTGEAYVVFGGNLPASVDLISEDADIAVYGRDNGDMLGRVAAGNLDSISPADLALGARGADVADGSTLADAGKVFVVYRQVIEPTPTSTTPPPTPTFTLTPTATTTATVTPTPAVWDYLPLILRNQ
ncbi:MAG: FG-GAP repeat protein [Anaerolineae bacterium]